jgi:type II secretory pathway pseudopilin PulG
MVGLTREQRAAREAERNRSALEAAKQSGDVFGTQAPLAQEQQDALNAIDERKPNWRPATVLNLDTGETAPDERRFAGDAGKALNQMVGRAAITENNDPQPYITAAQNAVPTVDLHNRPEGQGTQIRLLKGYQEPGDPLPPKRQPGEVVRVPDMEARRLVNLNVAKFTEA